MTHYFFPLSTDMGKGHCASLARVMAGILTAAFRPSFTNYTSIFVAKTSTPPSPHLTSRWHNLASKLFLKCLIRLKKRCPVSLSLCQFTNSHLSSAKSTKSQTIISTTWKQSEPVYKSKAGQSLLLSPISPQHRPGEWSQILGFNTLKVWGVRQIIFLLNTVSTTLRL